MKNCEMKKLFLQADRQIKIREDKKQETLACMAAEMEKKRTPVISQWEILMSQFLNMDKAFLFIYAALVCVGTGVLYLLQQAGADRNIMIISCMAGASVMGILTIIIIDKLFLGKMAELGASCYFNTKQCAAAYMAIMSSVNLVILLLMILYVGNCREIGIIQLGLYVITSFFLSNIVSLGILSTEAGRENSIYLVIGGAFLVMGYTAFSAVPAAFYTASLGIWGAACFVLGSLFIAKLKKVFRQIEKGEVLCMS